VLGLAEAEALPVEDASEYPRGAVVLSTDGTDRAALRRGVWLWGALAVVAGGVAGYLVGRWRCGCTA